MKTASAIISLLSGFVLAIIIILSIGSIMDDDFQVDGKKYMFNLAVMSVGFIGVITAILSKKE